MPSFRLSANSLPSQTCSLCKKNVGACIKCEDCARYFHVSCAWTAGYKFAFEIGQPKKKLGKDVQTVTFKDGEGERLRLRFDIETEN